MADIGAPDTRDRVFAGILLTSFAYLMFSVQDASIKLLVAGFSVWQILFWRSVTILAACVAIGGRPLIEQTIHSPIIGQMILRSTLLLSAWICFYTAIAHLQLAEITTIYFAAPVIVTVLSIPLLGEEVPLARWAAVFIGFAGVYIACNPTELGLSLPVLLGLAAAFFWALSIVLLRKIALKERTLVQLVLNNGFFLIVSALPMIWFWQAPGAVDVLLLAGVGAVGGMAQFTLFEGMKRAPVSVISPFEYTSLIWSFVLGFMIWGDIPRQEVFMGAALILSAGLLILATERIRKQDI